MKKLFPILAAVVLVVSACQLGKSGPEAIEIPKASATLTAVAPGQSDPNAKAGDTRISPADGMIEVFVPAGIFTMGGIDPRAAENEKPVHQVNMPGFWIDKVEVTNGMYALCVNAGACRLPQNFRSDSRDKYYGDSQYNDYPVVYVTWLQAKTYCEWAGRRLPTEAEWERAARGDDTRTYPWGDQTPDTSRANFGNLVGDTASVGNSAAGISPFGVLDMSGNVAEWTNDIFSDSYYTSSMSTNPQGPGGNSNNRVVRGGTYQDAEVDIRVSKRSSVLGSDPNATIDTVDWLGTFSPRIGFRCASNN
ncbi:gamma-glutamyl hercynylcysteine S-oxide synthase [Anaerolineales bacterium]|nr:gamma-glutamyl hercynylcysteine S-oxide synthase [Anaerolineales bacterium]